MHVSGTATTNEWRWTPGRSVLLYYFTLMSGATMHQDKAKSFTAEGILTGDESTEHEGPATH